MISKNKLFWFSLAVFLLIFTSQYVIFFRVKVMHVLLEQRLLKQVSVSVKSSTGIFLVCAKDLGIGILCHVSCS